MQTMKNKDNQILKILEWASAERTLGWWRHNEELPLQTPSGFDQMQPRPLPTDMEDKVLMSEASRS